jgi:transcriptional regulator with XRE-family HTH domain
MDMDIYTALGISVRAHRNKHGWSQEELGERAGLHPSYIGQIERGTKKVSIATFKKLAHAFRIRACDLLDEKAPKSRLSSWEKRICGLLKGRPEQQQKRAYTIIRELFRAGAPKKKR